MTSASFAFRKYAATFAQARLFGAIFAVSSLITPFFLGTVAGAIASGRVPAGGYGDRLSSWVNPTSLVGGVLAVTTCAFLAGVLLTANAARAGIAGLAKRLRDRTLAVGIVTGLIAFAGLYPVLHDAPTLRHGLLGTALPVLVVAALAGTVTLILLYRRSYSTARVFAAGAAAAVITGWGVGQYPWMLVDQLTINEAAGARTTLTALLVVVALAAVMVLPAMGYLMWITQAQKWTTPRLTRAQSQSHNNQQSTMTTTHQSIPGSPEMTTNDWYGASQRQPSPIHGPSEPEGGLK